MTSMFVRKKSNPIILIFGIIIGLLFISFAFHQDYFTYADNTITSSYYQNITTFDMDIGHGKHAKIDMDVTNMIFEPIIQVGQKEHIRHPSLYFVKNPNLESLYREIGYYNTTEKTVFVYPIFTQAAYGKNGFYSFYNKTCSSECLTVQIPDKINGIYSSSVKGSNVLMLLNYPFITDIDIDKNPDILKNYDKVILLHNEYVTKTEFDAIINHPNAVFLYPNALYAQVDVNYDKNTITLLRGHGYPPGILNGFNWNSDNSKYEYDYGCLKWNFYRKDTHTFLNCYPEYKMLYDAQLLRTLKENDPSDLLSDTSNWLTYSNNENYTKAFLANFDIEGTQVPKWVQYTAVWALNGEIKKDDLAKIVIYLHDIKVIH
jgi:hypothetical protein